MIDMRFYVYLHTSDESGDVFYVGSGGEKRYVNFHKKYKRAYDSRPGRRTRAWLDIARKGFSVVIVGEFSTDEEARQVELKLINEHKTTITNKQNYVIGWSDSKRKHSGRTGADHPAFGRTLSDETKLKKSKALRGESHFLFGRKLPDDWVDNIRKGKLGEKNPMYGKTGVMASNKREVVDISTGETYPTVTDAAKAIGIGMKTLYNKLSGHRKNNTTFRFSQ